ncbi:aspartate carbamoyltransferase [Candidatus Woesearchaeota archaeon]|nr:aspartate carbamoyltransferase [Candidatus Woesearchaeota archaeon]
MGFKNRDIISIDEIKTAEIIHILETAAKLEKRPKPNLLRGYVLATLFYEPSTRTRLSFESAMNRLGGKVIGFADPKASSAAKGESLSDSVKVIQQYADIIVQRHPLEGSARLAADSADTPVINAGDGANQHPTQTLLDLYTIKKAHGRISKLKVAIVGDLKYGRTVHSLAKALARFRCEMFFVSPKSLRIPEEILEVLNKAGIKYSEHEKVEDVVGIVDILYSTRIQRERFPDQEEYEKVKNAYILDELIFLSAKPNLKIMHPLPRVNEIKQEVDNLKHAYYFEQAKNGVVVRQALLALLLGKMG